MSEPIEVIDCNQHDIFVKTANELMRRGQLSPKETIIALQTAMVSIFITNPPPGVTPLSVEHEEFFSGLTQKAMTAAWAGYRDVAKNRAVH